MFQYIQDFLIKPIKQHVDYTADQTIFTVKTLMDEATERALYIARTVLPTIIYGTLFFGVGVIVAVIGAAQLIDRSTGIAGSGYLAGGVVLIIYGLYYRTKALPVK